MPLQGELPMILGCTLVSTIVLYIVARSMMESVDAKTVLLAAALMTAANGVHYFFSLPQPLDWVVVIVACFVIVKVVFDSTVYFAVLATAVWIGIQVLFYNYLAGSAPDLMGAS